VLIAGETVTVLNDMGCFAPGALVDERITWQPIEGCREIDGRLLPTRGSAVYAHPEGDFTYGAVTLRSIAYNVTRPHE
jgi:hypothetical protein